MWWGQIVEIVSPSHVELTSSKEYSRVVVSVAQDRNRLRWKGEQLISYTGP